MKYQIYLLIILLISLNYSFAIDKETTEENDEIQENTFDRDNIALRLREEMNLLETNAQTSKVETKVSQATNTSTQTSNEKITDLEEKINFRAAAVKRQDNMEIDDVSAEELDGDIFR
jgi:hypothetical protein